MSRVSKTEQNEAIGRLKEWLKPGDTVYTILRNVSSSGMQRSISLKLLPKDGEGYIRDLSWNVAQALGMRYDTGREAVRISGAGMDMGFEIVYQLAHKLFDGGFECVGKGCPSNDHSNGDRNFEPHSHTDAGYALKQAWL